MTSACIWYIKFIFYCMYHGSGIVCLFMFQCHHVSCLHWVEREGKWKINIFYLTHAVTLLLTIVQLPPLRANVSIVTVLCIYIISDISDYWLIMTLQPALLFSLTFLQFGNCDLSLLMLVPGPGLGQGQYKDLRYKQKILWKVESGLNRLLVCNQDVIHFLFIS